MKGRDCRPYPAGKMFDAAEAAMRELDAQDALTAYLARMREYAATHPDCMGEEDEHG